MKNRKFWISILAGVMAGIMLLTLVMSILPRQASAASSDILKEQLAGLQAEKDAITDKIEDLEKQQADNLSDMEGIMQQKDVIDQQVALLYAEITNVNEQIATLSLMIADKQIELDEAQARLDELARKNKERIRAMEEQGQLSYWSVIFKSNSFSDLLDRVSMVKEIAAADQRRLQEMNQLAQEVLTKKNELEAEKAELENTKISLEESQKVLDAKNAEADQLLADLVKVSQDMEELHNQFEAEEDAFLQEIVQTKNELNDALAKEESSRQESIKQSMIQASIEASIEASIQESIAESRYQAALEESRYQAALEESRRQEALEESRRKEEEANKNNNSGGGSGGSSNARWIKPCKYSYVSSPFGYRWHPVTGEYSMHRGVDLPAPKGTPIYASRSGYVTRATWHKTSGNYVTIDHQDGYSSVYMHMTHYVVGAGDYVKQGELIGYVGSTGRSTGPHLHFGIAYNGEYVNPMDYIG